MVNGTHLPIPNLFYAFAGLALFYFLYNFRRAFAATLGRPETRPIRLGEVVANALYFGVGQRKVASRQFGYASVMHLLLAWGFMELFFATSVVFLVERGLFQAWLPGKDTPWFAALNELGGLALLAGTLLALIRRHSALKPPTLPQNAWVGRGNFLGDSGILVVLLLLTVGGFLAESARLSIENPATARASFAAYSLSLALPRELWQSLQPWLWWSHAMLALALIAMLPQTKLFHSLIGIVNVALTSRAEHGMLRPMHITALMENPDTVPENLTLGVGQVEDFTTKQLLDAEACTECARCTSVCPAHVTGSPLSPMKIIQDIRHNLYAQSMHDRTAQPLIGGLISPDELWACTTCRACMEECPVLIDHIPAIVDLRRFLVLSEGKPPRDAGLSLEKTTQQGNPWGFPKNDRLKWALDAGLDVPLMADKGSVDILYWVGCAGAYDPRNQAVARSMVTILQAAGSDFAVLGTEERCTGDSARRLGEEYVYETLANQNMATLAQYRFNRIITTCPHCLQTLGRDYRQLGADWTVVHHAEFLEELIDEGRIRVRGQLAGKVTFHDPCYLGRHQGVYDAPRTVISRALGVTGQLVDMPKSRSESFCCGAGGGNMWHENSRGDRINLNRFDQVVATGAQTVATACGFCTIMLDDARKVRGKEESVEVKDIAELVAAGLS